MERMLMLIIKAERASRAAEAEWFEEMYESIWLGTGPDGESCMAVSIKTALFRCITA